MTLNDCTLLVTKLIFWQHGSSDFAQTCGAWVHPVIKAQGGNAKHWETVKLLGNIICNENIRVLSDVWNS